MRYICEAAKEEGAEEEVEAPLLPFSLYMYYSTTPLSLYPICGLIAFHFVGQKQFHTHFA